jgi:hypothetical protein
MERNIKPTYVKRFRKDEKVNTVSYKFSYSDKAMIEFIDYGNSYDIHFGAPDSYETILQVNRRTSYAATYMIARKIDSVINNLIDDSEIREIFGMLDHIFYTYGRDFKTVKTISEKIENDEIKLETKIY